MINQKRGKTVKDYYQIDKDHDLNSLLEMGLIKDVASFYEGNIFKYVYRHRNKNGLEDLKKARNYLNLLMELEYGKEIEDAPTDEAHKWLERLVGGELEKAVNQVGGVIVGKTVKNTIQMNREENSNENR